MHRIEREQFCEDPAGQLDRAEAETVLITKDGEPEWALVSYGVFAQLRRDNRTALKASELSDEEIAGIRDARMSPEYDHLDSEFGNDEES